MRKQHAKSECDEEDIEKGMTVDIFQVLWSKQDISILEQEVLMIPMLLSFLYLNKLDNTTLIIGVC